MVAEEVRNLAERTHKATDEIGITVNRLLQETSSMHDGARTLDSIAAKMLS